MTLDLHNEIIKNSRAVIYTQENGQRLFLLTQERDGTYTLPGGCKDVEDQDLLSALHREIKEELGLDLSACEVNDTGIQKTYETLYINPTSERYGKDTTIRLFLIKCSGKPTIKTSPEIKDTQWLNKTDAEKSLTAKHMKEMFLLGVNALN